MTAKRLSAALTTALLCTVAHADNKLFPTDLLAPRQADVQLGVAGTQADADLRASGVPGSVQSYGLGWATGARYGITPGLTLGALVTGGRSNTIVKLNNGWRDDTRESGQLATSLFARMAVPMGNSPYTVTTDLGVTHDNNHHGTTSFNVYSVGGTVSVRNTDLVRSYVSAGLGVPSKGYEHRTLSVAAGGWMLVNPGLTVTAELSVRRNMASSQQTGYNLSAVQLGLVNTLDARTSLRSTLSLGRTTNTSSRTSNGQIDAGHVQALSVSLHHLY